MEESESLSNVERERKGWNDLWKIKVPSKLKVFAWRLSQHSLPTGDVLQHRNMATTDVCAVCGAPDSWRHALLDCAVSRCTWALSNEELVQHMSSNQDPNAKRWLHSMVEVLKEDEATVLIVTLWAIWSSRIKAIHEAIFQTPHATHAFIKRFIADLDQIRVIKPAPNIVTRVQQAAPRPSAPPANYAKIHVDAAVRTDRGGSAAAICRNTQGASLDSSALVIVGVCDPATLEAIACREAIALAQDFGLQQFIVSLDCKQVIEDISKESQGPYGAIVAEINSRAIPFSCNFIFESRLVNVEAHKLARFDVSLPRGRHVWLGQPHDQVCIPPLVDFD